jgi:hypothetical protein
MQYPSKSGNHKFDTIRSLHEEAYLNRLLSTNSNKNNMNESAYKNEYI